MKNLISTSCNPRPAPPGKAERLTAKQRDAIVDFARKHAPALVERIKTAEFYLKVDAEWYSLLDGEQNPVDVYVHQTLWENLFG